MISNILKILGKTIHILISKFPTLISVIISFIIENSFNVAQYIPILADYEHELNIALYTIVLGKLLTFLKGYMEHYIVKIESCFFENKYKLDKERIHDVVDVEVGENPSRIYLRVKFSGYYKELKNYQLGIMFPTWVDLNDFPKKGLLRLDEKEIYNGLNTSNVIIDFSKIDLEEDNYKEGSKIIPLDFIINSIEDLGDTEMIKINIKSNKKFNMLEFKSNKLKIFSNL